MDGIQLQCALRIRSTGLHARLFQSDRESPNSLHPIHESLKRCVLHSESKLNPMRPTEARIVFAAPPEYLKFCSFAPPAVLRELMIIAHRSVGEDGGRVESHATPFRRVRAEIWAIDSVGWGDARRKNGIKRNRPDWESSTVLIRHIMQAAHVHAEAGRIVAVPPVSHDSISGEPTA